jgi:predicted GTPase
MPKIKTIIAGAAGRDFHNFNVFFKNNPHYEVVAFTAAQIPNITNRRYPPQLSGKGYPKGIPIYPEGQLPELIDKHGIDLVVLSYSDLPYMRVMHKAALVNTYGADFTMLGIRVTMLKSSKPVIAVTAVRTGCGKSQTTRKIAEVLQEKGKKVVIVRHPMPYGDLKKQACQKYKKIRDLDKYKCTIEEREEYEPIIEMGITLFAGVDYERILREAEKELGPGRRNGVIIWDGGNNDTPFFKPDLHICLVDPLRPGHETTYYPGEQNFRLADVILINKAEHAKPRNIKKIMTHVQEYNPSAAVVTAYSEVTVNKPHLIEKKNVLVVEDGPTLTHGGMAFGAGTIAARENRARIINPRPYAVGSIKQLYKEFPKLKMVVPAMGYSPAQIKELQQTINTAKCDAVVAGTPIDLRRVLKANKPIVRVKYELKEVGRPTLSDVLAKLITKIF